jgi:hypothetical protein
MWGLHLRSSSAALQIRSSDPAALRAWVLAKSGIDVPLHSGPLVGARIVSGHPGTAEIAYRIGHHDASVLVSHSGAVPVAGGALVSWVARGQSYTLACDSPEDFRACVLCHVGS